MQESLAEKIEEQELTTALIIDDAFDDPLARDVIGSREDFIDSLPEGGLAAVGKVLDRDELTVDEFLTLIEQDDTVQSLYDARDNLPNESVEVLFAGYHTSNADKRTEVNYITSLLNEAGLNVIEQGSRPTNNSAAADIIFVDLFFNDSFNAQDAATDAAEKIGPYIRDRADTDSTVPLVILVSSKEPDLNRVYAVFRDSALIPGCRFTFMKKRLFRTDRNEAVFRILQMVRTNNESQIFEKIIRRIETASLKATESFVKKLRQFELSDYADLSELVVRAEGIPLHQYLLELYALAWASFAESSKEIVTALEQLDSLGLTVDKYPPNAFVPSKAVLDLYESALYRPACALGPLKGFKDFSLGDVLIGENQEGELPTAYLVIVQDCDMARGERPDAAFLISGDVAVAETTRAIKDRFPLTIEGRQYSVKWNNKKWLALRSTDFDAMVSHANLTRAMRLKSPWALIRQIDFFRNMSRPAAMTAPHQIDAADVEILFMDNTSRAHLVRAFNDEAAAYLLHGRDNNDSLVRLVLSQQCAAQFREEMREAVDNQTRYSLEMREWLKALLDSADQLQQLHSHLIIHETKRKQQAKPNEAVGVALKTDKHWQVDKNTDGCKIMINVRLVDKRGSNT